MKVPNLMLALLVLSNLSCHSPVLTGGPVSAKTNPTSNSASPTPAEVSAAGQEAQGASAEQNGNLKVVPTSFKGVDFKNFSYPYDFSDGKNKGIPLKDGEYEYEFADDRGWFSFSDVYFVDLTGDANPEALVALSHVSCGGSCDGGAYLFYVYTVGQNKMKVLWQFETGSLGYGCGLKSFSTKNMAITVELFGRCGDAREENTGIFKFQTKDATRLAFKFEGRKIVEVKKEYISSPERSVKNYQAEISINN